MSKKISLEDVFENYCEHIQCQYNYDETCDYGDVVSEYMSYNRGDNFATCNGFKVKEGYCEHCGRKLKRFVDYYPYGDTHVPYEYWECPNC